MRLYLVVLAQVWLLGSVCLVTARQGALQLGKVTALAALTGSAGDRMAFYVLRLTRDELADDKNLIIQVETQEAHSDPNVFLSFTSPEPDSAESSEVACTAEGRDTCTIASGQLKNVLARLGDIGVINVFVGIECTEKCRYQIHPTLQKIIQLKNNFELKLDLETNESKLFKLRIPATSALGGKEDDHIRTVTIQAAPLIQSPLAEQNDIVLTATTIQGATPGTASRDIKGEPVWTQGKAIRLAENQAAQEKWCTDCWVTVLLSVAKPGRYSILGRTDSGEPERVYQGKKIFGLGQAGENVCYKYYIQDPAKNLDVRMKQYSGTSSLAINPAVKPKDHDAAEFKNFGGSDAVVRLSPAMRGKTAQGNRASGLYYICMFAQTPASYAISVQEAEPGQKWERIEHGFSHQHELASSSSKIAEQVFIYAVPPLAYETEDIALNFVLETISGPVPEMFVIYCNDFQAKKTKEEAEELCARKVLEQSSAGLAQRNQTTTASAAFKSAKQVEGLPILQLDIDHGEDSCTEGSRYCFYSIVVLSNSKDLLQHASAVTRYKLRVNSYQRNQQPVTSGVPIYTTISKKHMRYFKYDLGAEVNSGAIVKLSFQMRSIHGDADLFVSQSRAFPKSNDDNAKGAKKSNGALSRIDFDSALQGQYFIGVVAHQESSIELVAKVQFNSDSDVVLQEKALNQEYTLLHENQRKYDELRGNSEEGRYRMEFAMEKGFERPIHFEIARIGWSQVDVLLAWEREPVAADYDFILAGTEQTRTLDIPIGDRGYHGKGTLYARIVSRPSYFEQYLLEGAYQFTLAYRIQGSLLYLDSHGQQLATVSESSKVIYRYIVEDVGQPLVLSLLTLNGLPVLKTGFEVETANAVNDQEFDQLIAKTPKYQTLEIKSELQQKSCTQPTSSCILYIGLFCRAQGNEACRYQLKMRRPADKEAQNLVVGIPVQDTVEGGGYAHFYVTLSGRQISKLQKDDQRVYIGLTSSAGDADLFVNLQPASNAVSKDQWRYPDDESHDFESTLTIQQDVVLIEASTLDLCRRQLDHEHGVTSERDQDAQECTLVISVYGKEASPFNQFDLVARTNMQQLSTETPVQVRLGEGEYQYFFYDVECDDCTILLGLQSFSGGDPDLFVNFGQDQLPTKDQCDFASDSYGNEVLSIDLNNKYFAKQKLSSMKGTYTVATYGKKAGLFILSASQDQRPIIVLTDGLQVRKTQSEYETQLFKWQTKNLLSNIDDIKIEIKVKSGKVDLYVNTFDQVHDAQNIVQKLPTSRRDSAYSIPNVRPSSSPSQSELIWHRADKDYCQSCLYLIGVHSHDEPSDYELKLSILSADFKNSNFLKMGVPAVVKLEAGETGVYKFIIDEKADVQITQSNNYGETETYVSLTPSKDGATDKISSSGSLIYHPTSEKFHTAKMYFIIVESTDESQFTLLVTQKQTIIDLTNGISQRVTFTDINDVSKNFALRLPPGNRTLTLQIHPQKSKTQELFIPRLYFKQVANFKEAHDTIDFPPNGDDDFTSKSLYEKRGFLTITSKLQIDSPDAAIVFSLYAPPTRNQNSRAAHDVLVFASYAEDQVIQEGQEYLETMFNQQGAMYMKLDQSFVRNAQGYTVIEIANCLGNQETTFLVDPENADSVVEGMQHRPGDGRLITQFKNPVPESSFYAVVRASDLSADELNYRDQQGSRSQFMIKAYTSMQPFIDLGRIKAHDRTITHSQSPTSPQVYALKWQALEEMTEEGSREYKEDEVRYSVYYSQDLNANLASVCVMNDEVAKAHDFLSQQTYETSKEIGLMPGKVYNVNVIAHIFAGPDKGTVYPYQAFRLETARPLVDAAAKEDELSVDQADRGHELVIVSILVGLLVVAWLAARGKRRYCFCGIFRSGIFSKCFSRLWRRSRPPARSTSEQIQHELGTYTGIGGARSFEARLDFLEEDSAADPAPQVSIN